MRNRENDQMLDAAAECDVRKRNIIRVRPTSFDTDWKRDLENAGITVPENVSTLRYTPVNHDPMPFSLEVDLDTRTLYRRIIGVIPNAAYRGHIYSWEEFLKHCFTFPQ